MKKRKSFWGKLKVAARIFSKPFYASMDELLLEKQVGEEKDSFNRSSSITWRPATPADLEQFAGFLPGFKIRLFRKRFEDREYCLIGVEKEMIVHYCWLAMGEEYFDRETAFRIDLSSGKAYLYDAFTRPSFRNRGIYRAAIREAARLISSRGLTSLLVIVEKDNPPAIAAAVRSKFIHRAKIRYRRVLWFRQNRVETIPLAWEASKNGNDLADNQ